MLSVKINPEYFKLVKVPSTTRVKLSLTIPTNINILAVFPLVGSSISGNRVDITANGLVIDETALKYESDNVRNTLFNQIAEAITYRRILCKDVDTGVLRTDADVYAYANSGSWGSLPAGTALLSENNLSDLADARLSRNNLGLGSAATHDASDFELSALDYTIVSQDITITTSTSSRLYLTAMHTIDLGTVLVNKCIKIAATSTYSIVIPATVSMYYNGVLYTNQTVVVPSGYCIKYEQVDASTWFVTGTAVIG